MLKFLCSISNFNTLVAYYYASCKCTHTHTHTDNELPDYIMVMLANKKTIHQINNDLQLFLGEHTDVFTSWLQKVLSNQDLSVVEVEGRKKETGEGVCVCRSVFMYKCQYTCTCMQHVLCINDSTHTCTCVSECTASERQPDPNAIGSKRRRSVEDDQSSEPEKPSPTKVAKTTVEESKKEVKVGTQIRSKLKLDHSEGQRSNVRKVIRIIKVCL